MLSKRSSHENQDTQYAIRGTSLGLCLSTSRASNIEIDRELQIAGQAGFSCVELWAPALEVYLARHPVVWLDLQMRQRGIHNLVINGLAPLSIVRGIKDEDALVSQARFLELCTYLDTLGGATIVLHPAAGQEDKGGRPNADLRVLRAFADLAAPFEVSLALEFRADSTVPTLGDAQDLVKRAARSNLCLSLSTREWCASEKASRALDTLESGQLALVHVDSLLSQPSQAASVPEPSATQDEPALTLALCAHLAAAGFHGPYCISLTSESGPTLDDARAARQAASDFLAPLYGEQRPP